MLAAILAVPTFGTISAAVDYASLKYNRSALQMAADAAALATAKELVLSNAQEDALSSLANDYVLTNLGRRGSPETTAVTTNVSDDRNEIGVTISYHWKPLLIHYFSTDVMPIQVSATAKLAGKSTICMIGLEEERRNTIHLVKRASLEAGECGVYSNSSNSESVNVEDDASLSAGVTCSAGGVRGVRDASIEPEAITDCPRISDPLADRMAPQVGGCDHTGFEVKTGMHTLYPGTYCGGLKVRKDAKVRLEPGIYVITGDKLEVTDDAVFEGENVGFFLSGHKAKLVFKKRTMINLTAPTDGVMAGLLMFEDRTAERSEKHEISSDYARLLLGTIYLPNGTLRIDSEAPVSDRAAYTAIIARTIELAEGPTLYLNSDYEDTDVPVPEGLVRNSAYLSR